MQRKWIPALLLAASLLLTGCAGKDRIDTTTLSVLKDGSLELLIVKEFQESLYSLEGLNDMILQEKGAYNETAGKEAVVLKSSEVKNDIVYVDMVFEDDQAYAGFSDGLLFNGTIGEAYDAGYGLEISLKSPESGTVIGKEELMGIPEAHILILEENMNVRLPGKVLYVSDGVTEAGRKREVSVAGDALHYIVYE